MNTTVVCSTTLGVLAGLAIGATLGTAIAQTKLPPPPLPPPEGVEKEENSDGPNGDEEEHGKGAAAPSSPDEAHYFNAYGTNIEITRQMLKDETRTLSYAKAIFAHPQIRNGGVVLDVGCGTGVLSIFAALAGARKVYAVEASAMAATAAAILAANGVAPDVVTLLPCRLEDAVLPEKVDVVISEWMGMSLLFEAMWESVLLARDRWLKPGGCLLPSTVEMYAAPVEAEEHWDETVGLWSNVWGIDMSAVVPQAKEAYLVHPHFERTLEPRQLLAAGERVLSLDMATVGKEEEGEGGEEAGGVVASSLRRFSHTWTVKLRRAGTVHGLTSWFVCLFEQPAGTVPSGEEEEEDDDDNDDEQEEGDEGKKGGEIEAVASATRKKRREWREKLRGIIAALEASLQRRLAEEGEPEGKKSSGSNSSSGGCSSSSSSSSSSRNGSNDDDDDFGPGASWKSSWWLRRPQKSEGGTSEDEEEEVENDEEEEEEGDTELEVAVALDTSPLSPLTHWGHPLYCFDEAHAAAAGEEIGLRFIMEQNSDAPRHYHITIEASPSELPDPWYEVKWFPLWQ